MQLPTLEVWTLDFLAEFETQKFPEVLQFSHKFSFRWSKKLAPRIDFWALDNDLGDHLKLKFFKFLRFQEILASRMTFYSITIPDQRTRKEIWPQKNFTFLLGLFVDDKSTNKSEAFEGICVFVFRVRFMDANNSMESARKGIQRLNQATICIQKRKRIEQVICKKYGEKRHKTTQQSTNHQQISLTIIKQSSTKFMKTTSCKNSQLATCHEQSSKEYIVL